MEKKKNCKNCGAEISSKAYVCPSCGAKNKPPVYKRVWFWILVIIILSPIISSVFVSNSESNSENTSASSTGSAVSSNASSESAEETQDTQDSAFSGECPISASAQMGSSVIGYPELTISIFNPTEKDVAAVQFYSVPYDVYGDEITGWTSQNKLYTDSTIGAGQSSTISYQFIEDSVKTVKLYIYSVYFTDGTEWGDKEATKSTAIESGMPVEVSGQS